MAWEKESIHQKLLAIEDLGEEQNCILNQENKESHTLDKMIKEKYIIRGKNQGSRFRIVLDADTHYNKESSSLKSIDTLETKYDFFGTQIILKEYIGKEILEILISDIDKENIIRTKLNLEQHFERKIPKFEKITL